MRYLKIFVIIVTVLSFCTIPVYAKDPFENVTARAMILVEPDTDTVLYAKNEFKTEYPASITKLMTALLAFENDIDMDEIITVSETAYDKLSPDSSTANLIKGEQLSMYDLFACLLIPSANEAANVIAEHVAGSIDEFVKMMNDKAQELGLKNTHFMNPHGLHEENHYTCAYDVYLIVKEILQVKEIAEICSMQNYTLAKTNKSPQRNLVTTNHLISKLRYKNYYYDSANGIKTGYTSAAGLCLVSSAERDGIKLISVVLGCQRDPITSEMNSFYESAALLDYGFEKLSE